MPRNTTPSKLPLLLSALTVVACGPSDAGSPDSEDALLERARGIHERVITLDTHDDISPANFTPERNYTMDLPTQVNLRHPPLHPRDRPRPHRAGSDLR
jgi:hypothetical protein